MKIGIKRLDKDIPLPKYQHEGDSGMDLRAVEDFTVLPKSTATIGTGICVQLPEGYEFQVRPRSGLASKNGIWSVLGTIDQEFSKEIKIILYNSSNQNFRINKGDRIAQLVLQEVPRVEWEEMDELVEYERQGFGESGIK